MSKDFLSKKKKMEAIENGKGINYVMNKGYEILRNAIIMFDTSYNLLAYIEGIDTDDPFWNELTTLGTFSPETVDFFNKEKFIKVVAQSDFALLQSDKLKYDRANGKLFSRDGVQLANIIVTACMKPFEEGDLELIEVLCGKLSIELQNSEYYQKIDRVYQETLLYDLIDGTIPNDDVEMKKFVEFFGDLKAYLHLVVVDISQYDQTVTHLAYFRDLLKKIQPEYKYYIHLNNILAIIDSDSPRLSIENDLHLLNSFFSKYRIYAGISSCFESLLELRKHYQEAIYALNDGLNGDQHQNIFNYDNISVKRFMHSATNDDEINRNISPIIFSILAYDKEKGTSLLELLRVYLMYGKDAALTCENLNISLDSLNYCLQILEDEFYIKWHNGDMLCNLFLSIKLLDYLPNYP